MSRNPIKLSIVIPAYNEESKIEKDIREAEKYLKKAKIKGEIIVSTDGCTDRTAGVVRRLKREFSNLSLIESKINSGKGGALKKGIGEARGEYIMFADAGYCVPFEFTKVGIDKIKEGVDCALASRAMRESVIVIRQPLYRQWGSRLFGFIVWNLVGIPKNIKDTQCGFKIYRKEVAKKLFSELETMGMMFDIELILRAKKEKFKMVSFPVEWKNDFDTSFEPFPGSVKVLRELFLIKTRYRL